MLFGLLLLIASAFTQTLEWLWVAFAGDRKSLGICPQYTDKDFQSSESLHSMFYT